MIFLNFCQISKSVLILSAQLSSLFLFLRNFGEKFGNVSEL